MSWLSGTYLGIDTIHSTFGKIMYVDFRMEADVVSPLNLLTDLEILAYITAGTLLEFIKDPVRI